jgi:hypothetical protein
VGVERPPGNGLFSGHFPDTSPSWASLLTNFLCCRCFGHRAGASAKMNANSVRNRVMRVGRHRHLEKAAANAELSRPEIPPQEIVVRLDGLLLDYPKTRSG